MKTTEQLNKLELTLKDYAGEDRIIPSSEVKLDASQMQGHKTSIPSLDRFLNGVEGGELIVVTGPTGEGKTTMLMSITQNMSREGIQSCWFSMEVTPQQFLKKIMGAEEKPPLFYLPNKLTDNTVKWLEERIVESVVKYNTRVIFIDHIHMIFSLSRVNQNISLEIGDIVAKIKDIAVSYGLVIFLIAHCRDNSERPNAEIRKEDIRDSGLIIRLADSVVAIWRIANGDEKGRRPTNLEETDNQARVRVLKNRREGKLGSFVVVHNNHRLEEVTDDYNDL